MLKKAHWTDTPCEEATGYLMDTGYIKVYSKKHKRTMAAHLIVCLEAHGPRPSKKHTANHKCENKKCVNPHHLEWTLHSRNLALRPPLGRPPRKFCDATVLEAVSRVRSGELAVAVAASLGLHYQNVSDWVRGKSRRKVTGIVYNPREYIQHD